MKLMTRRQALIHSLFGVGLVGLRSVATGIPISILLDPRRALATGMACPPTGTSQFLILNSSYLGDAINTNVPGTYTNSKIAHPQDPTMAPTSMTVGGQAYTAALPWTTLPSDMLARTCFFHNMTKTVVHPDQPNVMKLSGAVTQHEMLVSMFAAQLSGCLGTVQTQPISLGATNSAEALTAQGAPLPMLSPLALASILTAPGGPLATLEARRDANLQSDQRFVFRLRAPSATHLCRPVRNLENASAFAVAETTESAIVHH